jgi:hypothetical protein
VDPYPDGGSIGEGYQFDEYLAAVCNVALAYVVAQEVDPERAQRYGAKGVEILHQMSTPEGDPHAPDPLRDQGYGIRYAGVGMALAYDWLNDAMNPDLRLRVYTALNRWLAEYEKGGLGRDHAQGNYVAGYIAAKALAALATEGDNPLAAAHWEDFLERVHDGRTSTSSTPRLRTRSPWQQRGRSCTRPRRACCGWRTPGAPCATSPSPF